MNFDVIFNYMPMYTKAFLLTIKIGWIGIALSIGIGIVAAFILHFKIPVLSQIVKVYVELFRNTPLFGAVILYLFWTSEDWSFHIRRSVRSRGIRPSGWKLYGREFPKRTGGRAAFADGICAGIGNEPAADVWIGKSSAGFFYQCTGNCGEYHLSAERNQCIFCNQSDGPHVYCKRPDWTVL